MKRLEIKEVVRRSCIRNCGISEWQMNERIEILEKVNPNDI